MSLRPAVALLLLAACNAAPVGTTDSGGSTAASASSTDTSGHVSTTSTGAPPTTSGSASVSDTGTTTGTTGTTTGTTGPVTATDTSGATSTTTTTASTSTGSTSGSTSTDGTSGSTSGTSGSTSTDGTSGSTDSTSGTTGTSTGAGECVAPADCPPPSECRSATCTAGVCGEALAPAGTPCPAGVCDELGACVACVADDDCPLGQLCDAGTCVEAAAACLSMDPDPNTGQRCPLFMPCAQSSECGVFQGCQQWFCNNAKTCELNALVDCGSLKGGGCNAGVVFVQHDDPPVDKRFVPPDGVNFREVASLAFTVHNNTASDIYLDKLPVALELMGNASKFDVSSAKIFDNSGGAEHGPGDLLVCLTADPFSFPANGVLGPCAGSAFSRVPAGGSNQFIVNLAFAKEKTYIDGRSYRLKLSSLAGVTFKVGFNGPAYAGTTCGVPPEGFVGAWVTAQDP